MARKSGPNELIVWGLFGIGTYVLYTKARTGDFGPTMQKLANDIHNTFGGLGVTYTTPGGAPPPGGTTPPPGGTAPCPPVAGYRYVAPDPNGGFLVVWKSAQIAGGYPQAQAEQAYNARVAAEGCV